MARLGSVDRNHCVTRRAALEPRHASVGWRANKHHCLAIADRQPASVVGAQSVVAAAPALFRLRWHHEHASHKNRLIETREI
jgi:hypothetical protein